MNLRTFEYLSRRYGFEEEDYEKVEIKEFLEWVKEIEGRISKRDDKAGGNI